jgi:hypothetical protein
VRVQYSVFERRLKEERLNRLRARMAALIEPAEDSVRIYRLCAECAIRLEIQGLGQPMEDPDVYVLRFQEILMPGKRHASDKTSIWHGGNGGRRK